MQRNKIKTQLSINKIRMDEALFHFQSMLEIMNELRENCPWDKKQSWNTLKNMSVEELYELVDAIEKNDTEAVKEELGDLILHILFYARIAMENNDFDIVDVLQHIESKIIHRHPHIYSNTIANTEDEVKSNWEQIKLKEGKTSVLSGVPDALPALVKATRMQEKVKQVGFDWENKNQVWEKLNEELAELQEAEIQKNKDAIEDEMGDVFFALINYARFIDVDPESALQKSNIKFRNRFMAMEQAINKDGKNMKNMTLEQMDEYWNMIKKTLQ